MAEQTAERLAVGLQPTGLSRGDADAETAAVGEIRQGLPPGRVLLAEDQLTLGSFGRPPMRDAALQRAQQPARIAARIAAGIAAAAAPPAASSPAEVAL